MPHAAAAEASRTVFPVASCACIYMKYDAHSRHNTHINSFARKLRLHFCNKSYALSPHTESDTRTRTHAPLPPLPLSYHAIPNDGDPAPLPPRGHITEYTCASANNSPTRRRMQQKREKKKKRRHDGNQVLSFMSGEARRACLFADVRRGRARNFSVHHTRACVCARPRRLSYESVFVQHMRTCLLIVYCLAREINKSFAYLINQRIN